MSSCHQGIQGVRGPTGDPGKNGVSPTDDEVISAGISFISGSSTTEGKTGVMCHPFKTIQLGSNVVFTGKYTVEDQLSATIHSIGRVELILNNGGNISASRANVTLNGQARALSLYQCSLNCVSPPEVSINLESCVVTIPTVIQSVIPRIKRCIVNALDVDSFEADRDGLLWDSSHIRDNLSIAVYNSKSRDVINDVCIVCDVSVSIHLPESTIFRSVMKTDTSGMNITGCDTICLGLSGTLNCINSKNVLKVPGISTVIKELDGSFNQDAGLYVHDWGSNITINISEEVDREFRIYARSDDATITVISGLFHINGLLATDYLIRTGEILTFVISRADSMVYVLL